MASFSPSHAELALVNTIFAKADPSKLGIVTGDAAVKIFAGAKLPSAVLGEIWAIADKENNGFLTRKGIATALRLIGHAQKGEPVKEALVDQPGPLAHIEGFSPTIATPSSPPPRSPPPRSSQQFPPLTTEDKNKFLRLFIGNGPINGLLSGDKARDVFVKSKLPYEKLSQIWALADTQDRGALDQADFTIAMYLIQGVMSGQIAVLPQTLPPGLYEQAGGRGTSAVVTHATGSSISALTPSLTGSFPSPLTAQTTGGPGPRARPLQPQATGQDYSRLSMAFPPSQFAASPVAALGANAFGGTTQQQWDVTPEEKARCDQFFDSLDTQKRGYIEGDVAVPFMLQSKLSEDILAVVWDLADLSNNGRLTRDGFAVAMHLIQGKLAGKEIPSTLPLSLVPPSMRAGGSIAAPTPAPPVSEPIKDLLWDDEPQAPTPTPTIQPQVTGRIAPQRTGTTGIRSPPIPPTVTSDPFSGSAFNSPGHRDLLSDDETTPTTVPDNSAEIGNLKNQVESTNRSLESTRKERESTESTIASQASQLAALQTQLSSAKAAYETETRLLTALRERFASQSAEIARAREELIRAESDLSGVRVEKAEIEGSLLRDKEEVRDLQRKMKEVDEEVKKLRADTEKAKKDTKHQKGLLAIAKKQLATREAERAKVAKDFEEADKETSEATQELQESEAALAKEPEEYLNGEASIISPNTSSEQTKMDSLLFAATQPLPASPNMSPVPSIASPPATKTNNPFERLARQNTGSRPATPISAIPSDIFSIPTPHLQQDSQPASIDAPTQLPGALSPFAIVAETSSSTALTDDPFGLGDAEKESSTTSVAPSIEKPDEEFNQVVDKSVDEPGLTSEKALEEKLGSHISDTTTEQFKDIPGFVESSKDFAETDLGSNLVEKEVEESDSDSDNDFHDAKEARASLSSPGPEGDLFRNEGPSAESNKATTDHKAENTETTFADAFGFTDSSPKVTGLPSHNDPMEDLFFSPPVAQPIVNTNGNGIVTEKSTPFGNLSVNSGVNAFDEAMGKIPSTNSTNDAPQFQLGSGSGFDDNFDFSAAKANMEPSPFPPVPTSTTTTLSNGGFQSPLDSSSPFSLVQPPSEEVSSVKPPTGNGSGFSFDDAFGTPSASQAQPSPGDHGISFEDAFGGGGSKVLALGDSFTTSASTAPSTGNQSELQSSTTESPAPTTALFPITSPPRSPKAVPTPSSPSTARSSTPPPRRSTGSGSLTDSAASVKSPPPARHSKLSIRLPFGRKDKKKNKHEPPPMPPPPNLETVPEPSNGTPAVEDDVQPVKQLCSMGFSRSQAVEALEKHGYDVQRALNSLLGAT